MADTPIPADVLEAALRLWFDDLNFANDIRGAIPIIARALLAERAAQAERIRELENRLGCATHNAAVATIGHAQLNEYIAIFDGLGFRGVHVDEQVRRAAAELRALRAKEETR